MNGGRVSRASQWPLLLLVGLLALEGCDGQNVGVFDVQEPGTVLEDAKAQGGSISGLADAMTSALQDEYRAQFTYAGVLTTLGEETSPFDMIVLAEAQHVASIADLFSSREWAVPESEWDLTNVPTFATRVEACIGGAEAEVLNIALYDELLMLELPPEVREVFLNVQAASRDHHLPAFRACSTVGSTEAMEIAIQDEYLAQATYAKILTDLGDILPFNTIVLAEVQHISSIAGLFTKRGLPVPESHWDQTNVATFKSRPLACAGGVVGENLNIEMYDELLLLELSDDVRLVFDNLRAASLNHHLPAFTDCAPSGRGAPAY